MAASTNSWRRTGGSRNPGPIRFICPLCDQGAGHACACFPDALPGGHRTVSLRPKSKYVAVVAVIVGQGLMFVNSRVLEYGALVWLCFHLFVVAYEEPTLRATFGPEYEEFCGGVARWIPRLSP